MGVLNQKESRQVSEQEETDSSLSAAHHTEATAGTLGGPSHVTHLVLGEDGRDEHMLQFNIDDV